MIPITNDLFWNDMRFIWLLFNEVCEFIDSMGLCSGKPVTEDDLNWIVNCIGDSVYKDSILDQCIIYDALKAKYITAPKEMEKMVMYGTDTLQVIIDEPCMMPEYYPPTDGMFLPDNRESRRHGYNYAKETSYKKPNRRRPWE